LKSWNVESLTLASSNSFSRLIYSLNALTSSSSSSYLSGDSLLLSYCPPKDDELAPKPEDDNPPVLDGEENSYPPLAGLFYADF
jgi:hypothetical protein